ncbi:MAG: hypothetical protein JWM12_2142, partial [Ilumatobacteraceae bacterium]|nr:hypothetical protein [Ilumatobacteraceae bacterium]
MQREVATGTIDGEYEERFAPVIDEFARNFD